MNKPKRENLKSVIAVSLKPPSFTLDESGEENHTYKCVYVTVDGKQVTQLCNKDVWKRCEGTNRVGRPRNGLCDKIHANFILWIDESANKETLDEKSKGIVVDIDVIPSEFYQRRQTMPDDMVAQETIELKILPSGAVEIQKVPPGVNRKTIETLISSLNAVETVNAGDTLRGFEIQAVSGNTVNIFPPIKG